ncbi:aminotransferase class III-fold pyridoxal phosphate-dependent enzyme [Halovulum dunhuangense]|uniref:Aminotransferase class III-fold pyridoxal phosphate-dependent enzyme n=1 Tax=Halovulum dunhuangense TaxID=1505036 RepID=A0A849L154_9RHOB|nr:aminotransferase [Halovulum dunhuangense]NNU79975.1 aminotransferase class III-fold pyridoxal phosphate-dependent enzyme [Halovulum dunhuangense]
MTQPLTNMQMRDVEALLHPYTDAVALRQTGPLVIDRGKGVRVWDDQGREYIEGMAGLWCCGLGFSDEELIEAAREQLGRLPYYHIFGGRSHEPAVELAEKIKELLPVPMARVFYQSSGSEANESQIKLQWYYNNAIGRPGKKKIISRIRAYHGVTIVSGSLTGLPANHQDFDLPVDRIRHTSSPHYWKDAKDGESEAEFVARLKADLEALIEREGPDTIAAMIAEPVMGAGGVIPPPKGYFEAIQPVLDAHDIALISDEVITGFGRTGNWFGAETLGMRPRAFSMAKQLTGGYAPLSAVAFDGDMAEAIEANSGRIGTFGHGFTYGGHPMGCAVGIKALEIYQRRDILSNVRRIAPKLHALLDRAAQHPLVGEARHCGLMGGLELAPPGRKGFRVGGKVGPRLSAELLKHGVILRPIGDTLAVCPPMIIGEDDLEALFAPMEAALDATMHWARAEGHLD